MSVVISHIFTECFSKMKTMKRMDEHTPPTSKIQLDVDSNNQIKRDVLEKSALENNISLVYDDNSISIIASGKDADLIQFILDSGYCYDLLDVKNKFAKLDFTAISKGSFL